MDKAHVTHCLPREISHVGIPSALKSKDESDPNTFFLTLNFIFTFLKYHVIFFNIEFYFKKKIVIRM